MSVINNEDLNCLLDKIKETNPLIHCLTNVVTVNDVANAIHAIGASPTMAHHKDEVKEISLKSNAIVLNLGASEYYDEMLEVISPKVPIVLDPVGVGASSVRRDMAKKILRSNQIRVIKGNYSEIIALVEDVNAGRGVDNIHDLDERIFNAVKKLSLETQAIVVATGAKDIIAMDRDIYIVNHGASIMSTVTGTGCMLGGILGAFLAVDNSFKSVIGAVVLMNLCGELSEVYANGPGSFKVGLFDNLYNYKAALGDSFNIEKK